METVTTKTHVGKDGVLKLELPVRASDMDVDVVVVISPAAKSNGNAKDLKRHLKSTFGSIRDETFVRPPQGEYEEREQLE